jgi:hypothetical protein
MINPTRRLSKIDLLDDKVLADEWNYLKNAPLDPNSLTCGSGRKVWWICQQGHEWQAKICDRAYGGKCPVCSSHKVLPGYNDLQTTSPNLATEWHPNLNGDLKPTQVTRGSHKKIWWLGTCGHEWQSVISDRSHGRGCPICAGVTLIRGINDLETVRPHIANEWHPTKNEGRHPSEFTSHSNKLVWWLGKCDHEWQATINDRSNGCNCPYCSGKRVLVGFNDLASQYPEIAAEWHPTKNGLLTPQMVTKGYYKKVWWRGKCGHEWSSTVNNRTSKDLKCPICSNQQLVQGFNDLLTTHPELAAEWHPTKNNKLTAKDVSYGSDQRAWWMCKKGHEWKAKICNRQRTNCPICAKEMQTSFPEKAIVFYLKKYFPSLSENQQFDWLRKSELDIYISSLNLAVEYDGEAWHKNGIKDNLKNQACADHQITLLRIREPKCPILNGISHDFILDHIQNDYFNLGPAIKWVFDFINRGYDMNLFPNVDLPKDATAIYSFMDLSEKSKSVAVIHPKIAAQWHPTKNGSLEPTQVSYGSGKKIWWICTKCGQEWQASPMTRSHGHGCPYCGGVKKR